METTCLESVATAPSHSVPAEPLAVLAARAAGALERAIHQLVQARGQNLGRREVQAAHDVRELLRQAVERGAQAKADATPPTCPVCGHPLTRASSAHARTSACRYGAISVQRTRGHCQRCRQWRPPADAALGLEESAGGSPAVQDMAAPLAGKMPVAEAGAVLAHLTGLRLPRATLDREAKRQGQRAQALRTPLDQHAATDKRPLELSLEPHQMILPLDAWHIRERDGWGQTARPRRAGPEPERWHWVYAGTCFRLDQRGRTAGGRPVITERGFVATRAGLDALRQRMHAEALRRGLGQAAGALVIGDGAVWLWPLADDRRPQARQRLDFYHAVAHLAAVGRALFAGDKVKLTAGLKPLVRQLKSGIVRQSDWATGRSSGRTARRGPCHRGRQGSGILP